jgi:hypothetical protein
MPRDPHHPQRVATLLRAARVRLDSPDRWLHDNPDEAVDAKGQAVLPMDPEAARWDVYGALGAEASRDQDTQHDRLVDDALEYLEEVVDGTSGPSPFSAVMRWHDAAGRTHEDVLTALDAAIVLADRDAAAGAEAVAPEGPGASLPVHQLPVLPDSP